MDAEAAEMTTPERPPSLGADLFSLRRQVFGMLIQVAEDVQLATDAFAWVAQHVQESKQETWSFRYPIGFSAAGQVLPGEPHEWKRAELQSRYLQMRDFSLPLTGVYQLVTLTDAWFLHLLRRVLTQFPKKLGEKRQVSIATILSAPTLEAARIAASDGFLHELAYRSAKEFAETGSHILGIEIEDIPAFARYVEVRSTRDIWIHNLGRANEVYLRKAGSHARVKSGEILPVDARYFLQAYESTLQLTEQVHDRLEQVWEPPAESPLFQQTAKAPSTEAPTPETPPQASKP